MNRKVTGNPKYARPITQTKPGEFQGTTFEVDVYDVLRSFQVTDPELQHAAKKILCCGIRGQKSRIDDLREIIQAIERAIECEEVFVHGVINEEEDEDEEDEEYEDDEYKKPSKSKPSKTS